MQNANNLSARQHLRMKRHVSDMSSFAMMDDINIKRKRLKETENRTARDRGDFRDKL
jgi:hypothetical protein